MGQICKCCDALPRRGVWRALARMLPALCLAAVPGGLWADRHCYPALDSYFFARQALQSDTPSCALRLERAAAQLDEARFGAELCGCSVYAGLLARLADVARDEALACADASAAVLDARAEAEAAVAACH